MYEKIIGNHVGIVVNDQDPEKRSRLQIFVPHITNTLFSNWNANLKDISFKTFETPTFSPDVIQTLKDTLPWAEAAVPSFGGGTSGPVSNFFHRAANVSMQYLMAGSSWAGLAAEYASGALVDHSVGYDNPSSLNLNSQGDPTAIANNNSAAAQAQPVDGPVITAFTTKYSFGTDVGGPDLNNDTGTNQGMGNSGYQNLGPGAAATNNPDFVVKIVVKLPPNGSFNLFL